jgi:hypothetical protein
MDSREAFEAVINNPPFELNVSQYPNNDSSAWPGDYRVYDVSLAWKIWQAAIAHVKQSYVLCEKEPEYWLHKQGDYNEPAWYELDEHQLQRGWTQEPLYRKVQDKMLALNNQMVAVEYDKQGALMGIAECLERMEKP